jgi:hypothetical protein
MKRLFLPLFAMGFVLASCGSKNKAGVKEKVVDNTFEIINLPCDEFKSSTSTAFRATQSQTSTDLSFSREKALTLAKQRLASLISTTMKSVTDRYANEYQSGNDMELKGKFENMTREIVNQQLNDITILCEKSGKDKDGKYITYIAVEISREGLKNAAENKLADKTKLGIDYDKMKFEKIFNDEMDKMAKDRP